MRHQYIQFSPCQLRLEKLKPRNCKIIETLKRQSHIYTPTNNFFTLLLLVKFFFFFFFPRGRGPGRPGAGAGDVVAFLYREISWALLWHFAFAFHKSVIILKSSYFGETFFKYPNMFYKICFLNQQNYHK